jgi:DNA-binding CsgD family transcriptional regulator
MRVSCVTSLHRSARTRTSLQSELTLELTPATPGKAKCKSPRKRRVQSGSLSGIPPLKTWDDKAMQEYWRALISGTDEWIKRRGYDSTAAFLRQTLLDKIADVISLERFERLCSRPDPQEQIKLAQNIREGVSRLLDTELFAPPTRYGAKRRGAKRRFSERDQKMYEMWLAGRSHEQIARRFKTTRPTVFSACRRIAERHKRFVKRYTELRTLVKSIGIVLEAEGTLAPPPRSPRL